MLSGNKGFFLQIVAIIAMMIVVLIGVMQINGTGQDPLKFGLDLSTFAGDGNINRGFTKEPKFTLKYLKDNRADIETNLGTIKVDLLEKGAPYTVNNFVFLAQKDYYDGTFFHRLIPGLLIQGGDRNTLNNDPSDDGYGDPGYQIADEINWDELSLSDEKRKELETAGYKSTEIVLSKRIQKLSVVMANEGVPNTNGSQFFIVLADSEQLEELEGKYTVFGEVIDGYGVLEAMNNTAVDYSDPNAPKPKTPIKIIDVRIYIVE